MMTDSPWAYCNSLWLSHCKARPAGTAAAAGRGVGDAAAGCCRGWGWGGDRRRAEGCCEMMNPLLGWTRKESATGWMPAAGIHFVCLTRNLSTIYLE